jgi:dihydrofolate reductase
MKGYPIYYLQGENEMAETFLAIKSLLKIFTIICLKFELLVSKSVHDIPGIKFVGSPQEAINYLQEKGHQTALIAGGGELHNAFIAHGLVDELIFNVAPVFEGKGLNLLLDKDHYQYKDVQLLDFKSLGGGVVQLHYAVGH